MTVQTGAHIIEGVPLPPNTNIAGAAGTFGPFVNAGVPAGGFLNNVAAKGALCIDTTTPKLWMNTGTLAATVWTSVGSQT